MSRCGLCRQRVGLGREPGGYIGFVAAGKPDYIVTLSQMSLDFLRRTFLQEPHVRTPIKQRMLES